MTPNDATRAADTVLYDYSGATKCTRCPCPHTAFVIIDDKLVCADCADSDIEP